MDDELGAEVFERLYRGDADGEAFHGPALMHVLERVPAIRAAARPAGGGHSIHEVVEHMLAWRLWACDALEGVTREMTDDGWVSIEEASEEAWGGLRLRLEASQARLVTLLRETPAEDLAPHRAKLRFLLHHELHHAGQVALLARDAR